MNHNRQKTKISQAAKSLAKCPYFLELLERAFVVLFAADLDFVDATLFLAAVGAFGALYPRLRASERPIATACLRLFTVLPLLPLFNLPRLYSFITFFTLDCAALLYFVIKPPLAHPSLSTVYAGNCKVVNNLDGGN